jgi:hypothetical protein
MKKRVVILKVDLYTRIVLTIIALALGGMLIKPIIIPAIAGAQGTGVQTTGTRGTILDVNIAQINGREPEMARPIRVSVARAQTIPVDITNPEAIAVRLEESAVVPVSLVEPETVSVEIKGPKPLPVVETWNKYYIEPKK